MELKWKYLDELYREKYFDKDVQQVYLKSEADKVIADLEESHKMEVEQLLMEIAKLKETLNNSRNARKYWRKEYLIEYKECLHQKFKRCLAMAKWCRTSARCDEGLGAFKYRDWYWKWFKRWLAIAEKFKPNPTINRKVGTNALQR